MADCCVVTESPKFHQFLLFSNLFTGSKLMREFNTKCSQSHKKTRHSGHPSYLHSLLSLYAIILHVHPLWSHLIILLNNSRLKSQIGLFIILLLLCGTVFLLTYVIFPLTLLLILSLIHLYFPFLLLSSSKKLKTHFLNGLFLLSLMA
jgi:hypothetical protein